MIPEGEDSVRRGEGGKQARAVEYWDCNDSEELLSHTDIGDAVVAWADALDGPLPESVTVYGFARRPLPSAEPLAIDILTRVLEELDNDLGDPDATEITRDTQPMREAAFALAAAIRADYEVWQCERVTKCDVLVAEHVPAEWLTMRDSGRLTTGAPTLLHGHAETDISLPGTEENS